MPVLFAVAVAVAFDKEWPAVADAAWEIFVVI